MAWNASWLETSLNEVNSGSSLFSAERILGTGVRAYGRNGVQSYGDGVVRSYDGRGVRSYGGRGVRSYGGTGRGATVPVLEEPWCWRGAR